MEDYEVDHFVNPIIEHLEENVPKAKWREVIGVVSMWVDAERKGDGK